MSDAPYVLHIWPSKWGLQSLDPTCLAAVMYLQLTIPGKFKVAPCTNPDESPNGQLPFLTHGHAVFSTFPSIVAFVSSLAKSTDEAGVTDLDASLTSAEKAQKTAWYSHVEGSISDLVSHMFYGIDANYWGLTNPALASEMQVPLKYYVPGRIRDSYKPRLEAEGLWSLPSIQQEKKNPFAKEEPKQVDHKVTFARAFEREKILEKARTVLGIHARSLDGKLFYFGDRPTSLDVYLASHILLLADPPFTDSVLQALLIETYPDLVGHARRVQNEVARAPPYEYTEASRSLLALLPRPFRHSGTQSNAEDIQYRKRTFAFLAVTAAAVAIYGFLTWRLITQASELGTSKGSEGEGAGAGEGEGESQSGEGSEVGISEQVEHEKVSVGDPTQNTNDDDAENEV